MHTMLPTVAALALLLGVSGCFVPVHDGRWDRSSDRNRWESRQPRVEGNGDGRGRDCWRQGDDWVCRNARD